MYKSMNRFNKTMKMTNQRESPIYPPAKFK